MLFLEANSDISDLKVACEARFFFESSRLQAQKRFSEVANAYETLSDPGKRQSYDLGGTTAAPGGRSSASDSVLGRLWLDEWLPRHLQSSPWAQVLRE